MISDKMKNVVKNNSVIRQMFEEGKKLEKIYGKENVYDFSLGNPSIESPKKVNQSIIEIIQKEDSLKIHGYMNNAGFEDVRETIANSEPNTIDFQPKLEELDKKINKMTKALIINSPNNPTGTIYSIETIKKIAKILESKQHEYGHEIFLISDEPYRELAYDGNEVPYITKYYNNTFVVYSYSKSLSIPGERIGYVIVPSEMEDSSNMINALTIANRIIGCVNAPSLMQKVIMNCIDETVDLTTYNINRNLLYNSLTEYGFECIKPQGALQ